jgi:hypothetical protein
MVKFFVLKFKIDKNSFFAEKGKISDYAIIKLSKKGVSLKGRDLNILLMKNKGIVNHFVGNLFGLPIFSEILCEVLKEYSSEFIELFPIEINRRLDWKFYFVNILNNVDAINYEESELELLDPNTPIVSEIRKLVIEEPKVNTRNIFRLSGFRQEIFVSEKLKIGLEKLNLDEIYFIPVEDFKWKLGSINF